MVAILRRICKRAESSSCSTICDCHGYWSDYWNGRRKNEGSTDDMRSPAQRDYARIIHSSAFRRLQRKTQVFSLGDGDFYRTRLTHSLEVSQIGEGIARNLSNKELMNCNLLRDSGQIRAICLAHDLGHPPFGHGGERALNKIMLKHDGFEGNGQSLRIMASIPSYDDNYGMNLTRRTLLGVMKYPASYNDTVNHKVYPKKNISRQPINKFKPPKCYLSDECDTIKWIKSDVEKDWKIFSHVEKSKNHEDHHETKYKSLDASILEIADDIAYGVHDLEDAIALGFVDRDKFTGCITKEDIDNCFETIVPLSYECFLNLLFGRNPTGRKRAIGRLVSCFVGGVKLEVSDKEKLAHPIFHKNANLPDHHKGILKKLNNIIRNNVIENEKIQQLEYKGKMIITKLFDAFENDPENLLPKDQRERYKENECKDHQMRVICDYIAGMTDDYAIRRYQKMFIPNSGSVFDM